MNNLSVEVLTGHYKIMHPNYYYIMKDCQFMTFVFPRLMDVGDCFGIDGGVSQNWVLIPSSNLKIVSGIVKEELLKITPSSDCGNAIFICVAPNTVRMIGGQGNINVFYTKEKEHE